MLLVILPESFRDYYLQPLRARLGEDRVYTPEQSPNPKSVRYAVGYAGEGILTSYPNLQAIFAFGAGVDSILSDQELPELPIYRMPAPDLINRMSEYIVLQVLAHHRKASGYRQLQQQRDWRHLLPQPAACDRRVGILGLGVLGRDAAAKLSPLGFQLRGWTRTQGDTEGIECLHGPDQLQSFLAETDIAVVLLPLTAATRHLINDETLSWLPRGASLINAARGSVVDEPALIRALDSGQLSEATVDVIESEPPSADHPFWSHPQVTLTPHTAGMVMPDRVADQIADAIDVLESGGDLPHRVDRQRGY